MRSAYIWANAFWQVAMMGGGSVLTYLSGSPWWVIGGFTLMFMGSMGYGARLDKWDAEKQPDG